MCLCMVYLFALFMLHAAWSQRAPTWDACECSWVAWQGWSTCSRVCYGRQVRERQVRLLDSCGTFRHCDGGAGAYDYRDCNTHCTYGSYDSSYGGCRCPAGRYGTCCDDVITCGTPQTTSNGAYTVSNSNNYGSVATYTCTNGYNMTGTATMSCSTYNSNSTYGNWTGSAPRCLFAESCNSSPCQNGGTCVNGLEMYTCVCSPGWPGINCEAATESCNSSPCQNGGTCVNRLETYTCVCSPVWSGINCEAAYPCDNLSLPEFGYVSCNGWRPDFGQTCLIDCRAN